MQILTSLNFSSVKDIQKNISLFDDRIYAAKIKLEREAQDSILEQIKLSGISGLTPAKGSQAGTLDALKPRASKSPVLEPSVTAFLGFLNNKVRMHDLK